MGKRLVFKTNYAGSTPASLETNKAYILMVENAAHNGKVTGSSPVRPIQNKPPSSNVRTLHFQCKGTS
jgi:hypothetical protein